MAQYKYTIISQNLAIPLERDNIVSDFAYHDRPRIKIYKSYK